MTSHFVPTEAAPARWTIRFHTLIAAVIVVSMLMLAGVLLWQGWRGARDALLLAANHNANDIGRLINEKARRIVGPAEINLRQLTYDPIAGAESLDQRMKQVSVLGDVLAYNPLISAVYVGYEDGSFFLLRPLDSTEVRRQFAAPARANFVVQSVERAAANTIVGKWVFLNANLVPIATVERPEYLFDPRVRPWFERAKINSGQSLTEPYVFFTTRQVGLTLSERSRNGRAVFGIDVALSDLSAEMGALRPTAHTEIAVVDDRGQVVAYQDSARIIKVDGSAVSFRRVAELGVPALRQLNESRLEVGKPGSFDVDDEGWFGVKLPLEVLPGTAMRVLVAIPDAELLADMRAALNRQAVLSLLIAAVLLPLGWLAGRQIGQSLGRLTRQGRDMVQFRFSGSDHRPSTSPLSEVRDLDEVLRRMGRTVDNFLDISATIGREPQTEAMLDKVLDRLVEATNCTQGAVYLLEPDAQSLTLAAVSHKAAAQQSVAPPSAPPNTLAVQEGLAWAERLEKTPGGLTGIDQARLALKLNDRQKQLLGLVVLKFHADDQHEGDDFRAFAEKLSATLEVSIETRKLLEAQKKLLDAVIQLLADAIDAKSPYTGGHCERVPALAEMMVDHLNVASNSPYVGRWNEDARYEFRLGAWLHDCGKITSPEYIIDKATKLETIYNRIHEIRMRFEVLHRDATIECLQGRLRGEDAQVLQARLEERHRQLDDDYAFVAACNVGGEAMADADIERLHRLSQQTWLRHFDDRVGLSIDEAQRLASIPSAELPARERLLADRADHVVSWGNRRPPVERSNPENRWGFDMDLPQNQRNLGELHNLAIRRGTLTDEDRFRINEHIVQTLIMLRSLPWPKNLSRVPDIAATHHEKLDGKGYPRRLKAAELSVEDRIMAIADIFEALTAADRPYKKPKTLSESLNIMVRMACDGHICPEMFTRFLRGGVWRSFATQFLRPEQIDVVDVDALIARLPAPTPI